MDSPDRPVESPDRPVDSPSRPADSPSRPADSPSRPDACTRRGARRRPAPAATATGIAPGSPGSPVVWRGGRPRGQRRTTAGARRRGAPRRRRRAE
eukprot:825670-Prorocentrum_minimum.AAC.1